MGFTVSQNQKQRGKKWFWKKKQTKDLSVAKQTCWRRHALRSRAAVSLGTLTPTFTCSQVDTSHLKVRRCVKAHDNGGGCAGQEGLHASCAPHADYPSLQGCPIFILSWRGQKAFCDPFSTTNNNLSRQIIRTFINKMILGPSPHFDCIKSIKSEE